MNQLAQDIKTELAGNGKRISFKFIEDLALGAECLYLHPTPRTRICILTLKSGHEVVGFARVLDPRNDIQQMGNEVAFENARDELWSVCGSIALAL